MFPSISVNDNASFFHLRTLTLYNSAPPLFCYVLNSIIWWQFYFIKHTLVFTHYSYNTPPLISGSSTLDPFSTKPCTEYPQLVPAQEYTIILHFLLLSKCKCFFLYFTFSIIFCIFLKLYFSLYTNTMYQSKILNHWFNECFLINNKMPSTVWGSGNIAKFLYHLGGHSGIYGY